MLGKLIRMRALEKLAFIGPPEAYKDYMRFMETVGPDYRELLDTPEGKRFLESIKKKKSPVVPLMLAGIAAGGAGLYLHNRKKKRRRSRR